MKKDIEWLKETLEERIDTMAKFEDVSYSIGLKEAYQHTLLLINQLDEPEVLSQEIAYEDALKVIAENIDTDEFSIGLYLEALNNNEKYEFLTEKWIEDNTSPVDDEGRLYVWKRDLENVLVPKREEVDQAYKDGYEKGKQHTFYKGYLEGLTDKGSEPETVASVVTTFWKSFERLKEVMNMEVEEMEE